MKTKTRWTIAAVMAVTGVTLVWRSQTQELQPITNPPPFAGTWYSLTLTNYPPLPFDPWTGVLPLFSFGDPTNRIWVYDDRSINYVALREQAAAAQRDGPPDPPGGGGSGTNTPVQYSPPYTGPSVPALGGQADHAG